MGNLLRRRKVPFLLGAALTVVPLAIAAAAGATQSLHASGSIDRILINLYEQHRFVYAIVVTGSTVLIALLLSGLTELIFKLFIASRLR